MSLIREYHSRIALLGAKRTTLAPCPPTQHSYLDSYQHFNWRSLEKHSGTLLQNKCKALGTRMKQSVHPGHWKSTRLPVLNHPDASHWLKSGGNQNDPLTDKRSQCHLRKKYTYLHFSSPVRFEVKPPPCQTRCDFQLKCHQHLQLRSSADSTVQDLVISGMTVPLARTDQYRRPKMEIHVYVPSGRNAESLDEGFLEEAEKLSMFSLEDSHPVKT